VTSKVIDVEDHPDEDILCELDGCLAFIDSALSANTGILVYCTAGMSRSATVVVAYVMKANACTVEEAVAIVRRSRRWIKPNTGFMDQLRVRCVPTALSGVSWFETPVGETVVCAGVS
jgi:protein-tyrosine phosphatase